MLTPNSGSIPEGIYQIEAFPPLREGGDWVLDFDALSVQQTTPIIRRDGVWHLLTDVLGERPGDHLSIPLTQETFAAFVERLSAEHVPA